MDLPFERVVLIGGAYPRAGKPGNPTLPHLGRCNIIFDPEKANNLKQLWHKWKIQMFFGDLVINSTRKGHQNVHGQF